MRNLFCLLMLVCTGCSVTFGTQVVSRPSAEVEFKNQLHTFLRDADTLANYYKGVPKEEKYEYLANDIEKSFNRIPDAPPKYKELYSDALRLSIVLQYPTGDLAEVYTGHTFTWFPADFNEMMKLGKDAVEMRAHESQAFASVLKSKIAEIESAVSKVK